MRKYTESAAAFMSIRRYLETPIDAWYFPPQELIGVYPGFSDADMAWFRRPVK